MVEWLTMKAPAKKRSPWRRRWAGSILMILGILWACATQTAPAPSPAAAAPPTPTLPAAPPTIALAVTPFPSPAIALSTVVAAPSPTALPPDSTVRVPDGYRAERYAQGLSQPTALAFGPDGRLYVAQLSGEIAVLDGPGAPPHRYISGLERPLGLVWRRIVRVRLRDNAPAETTDWSTGWGRPIGLINAPDGALLVADLDRGTITRIVWVG